MAKRVAFVVGIGNYEHYPHLTPSPNAARNIYQILTDSELGGCDPETSILLDIDDGKSLSLTNFSGQIMEFISKLTKKDQFIFYFIGHGEIYSGDFCLVLSTTQPDVTLSAYSFAELVRTVKRQGLNKGLFVVDACYSEGAIDSIKHILSNWSPTDLPEGFGFLTSSSKEEVSRYKIEWDNTVFTHHFYQCVSSGYGLSQYVTLPQIYNYIDTQIEFLSIRERQTPRFAIKGNPSIWVAKNKKYSIRDLIIGLSPNIIERLHHILQEVFFDGSSLPRIKDTFPVILEFVEQSSSSVTAHEIILAFHSENRLNNLMEWLLEDSASQVWANKLNDLAEDIKLETSEDTYQYWQQIINPIDSIKCKEIYSILSGVFSGVIAPNFLHFIFLDKRLTHLIDLVSYPKSKMELIEQIVYSLHNQQTVISEENALTLFFRVLQRWYIHKNDFMHNEVTHFLHAFKTSRRKAIHLPDRKKELTTLSDILLKNIVHLLMIGGAIHSVNTLKSLFVDERLYPWINHILNMSIIDKEQGFLSISTFLSNQYREDTNNNGLVLLLKILSERLSSQNEYHHLFDKIAINLKLPTLTEALNQIVTDLDRQPTNIIEDFANDLYSLVHSIESSTNWLGTLLISSEICFFITDHVPIQVGLNVSQESFVELCEFLVNQYHINYEKCGLILYLDYLLDYLLPRSSFALIGKDEYQTIKLLVDTLHSKLEAKPNFIIETKV